MSEPADLCKCEEERAAILEHDAKMSREDAEARVLRWRASPHHELLFDVRLCKKCPRVGA